MILLAIAFAADLAAGPTARTSERAQEWMKPCVAAIEHARDEYSRAVHRPVDVKITTLTGHNDRFPGECGVHILDSVSFEIPEPRNKYNLAMYSGSMQSRSGIDTRPTTQWSRLGWATFQYSHERHDRGRTAQTGVLDQDAPNAKLFTETFQRALDACMELAPIAPTPPADVSEAELRRRCVEDGLGNSMASCIDAERAAEELDRTCQIEGYAVGDGGRPGITHPALARITSLGAGALPILRRLARSKNPTARAAAAIGLGKLKMHAARADLEVLARDIEQTDEINGCIGGSRSVSAYAKDALSH